MKTMGWVLIGIVFSTEAIAETSLTVYNDNRAVVRQAGEMAFAKGAQTLTFSDIPARIDPTTVRLTVEGGNVRVLEQKFRYDLENSMALLRSYLNRSIAVRLEEDRLVEGVLLSASDNVVLRGDDGAIIILKADAIEQYDLANPPENMVTQPTLFWLVDSESAKSHDTEISYITGGISWRAVYNAVVTNDEKSLELSAWVSLENNSGMAYEDVALKLVAGAINRASNQMPQPMMGRGAPQMLKVEDFSSFEARGISEYHLYELGRNVSTADGETTQISLFEPATVTARKLYNYDANRNAEQVAAVMEFTNSEKSGLGIPLPMGTVRVYQRDTDGALELVGEDSIDHTARDEDVKITMGYAFDLAAERQVTDMNRVSQRIQEQTVEISLRNRTDEDVKITATEHLYGDWEIMRNSHEYMKKDAATLEFTVDVPAGGETLISYTVRIQ